MMQEILFYLFATVLIGSGLLVVTARNAVHAVLFLILAFFNAAGLFLLLGAEFLALILLIVYVGAVAVLFLFVVMMLDVGREGAHTKMKYYIPVAGLVGAVLLIQLGVVGATWIVDPAMMATSMVQYNVENTRALGRVLYTDYFYPFQVSGFILLVAMIGAIVLTQRQRKDVKRQNVRAQMAVDPKDVVSMRKVKTGAGAI